MEGLTLRLTLRIRNDGGSGILCSLDGIPTLALLPLPPPISLYFVVTKRATDCQNPPWHCFDIHIYTKDARDDVQLKINRSNSRICIMEQNLSTWPSAAVEMTLSGQQVTPLTMGTLKLDAPNYGKASFQHAFPVYFKKTDEADNDIILRFSVKTQGKQQIDVPCIFSWRGTTKKPSTRKHTQTFHLSGRKAIGVLNEIHQCNKHVPCSSWQREGHNWYDRESISPTESSEQSSLSDTETILYRTQENELTQGRKGNHNEKKTEVETANEIMDLPSLTEEATGPNPIENDAEVFDNAENGYKMVSEMDGDWSCL